MGSLHTVPLTLSLWAMADSAIIATDNNNNNRLLILFLSLFLLISCGKSKGSQKRKYHSFDSLSCIVTLQQEPDPVRYHNGGTRTRYSVP